MNSTIIHIDMIALIEKHISLNYIKINSSNIWSNEKIDLIYNAIYYSNRYFYFYKETTIFYFMLYNDVSDFTSGYSLKEIEENINENKNIPIYTNSESPLTIFGESKIKYLKFIRNTKLAYYEIETNDKRTYHGILDIKLNKIIFNTNEYIKDFRPLTNYSMLAITDDSAFEICPFTQDGKCIEDCEEGHELIINYEKGNYCKKLDNFNYILWIPIILGILLIIIAIIIIIIYIKRKKKKGKVEALFELNIKEKD